MSTPWSNPWREAFIDLLVEASPEAAQAAMGAFAIHREHGDFSADDERYLREALRGHGELLSRWLRWDTEAHPPPSVSS
jgi:hypothetical protein